MIPALKPHIIDFPVASRNCNLLATEQTQYIQKLADLLGLVWGWGGGGGWAGQLVQWPHLKSNNHALVLLQGTNSALAVTDKKVQCLQEFAVYLTGMAFSNIFLTILF